MSHCFHTQNKGDYNIWTKRKQDSTHMYELVIATIDNRYTMHTGNGNRVVYGFYPHFI